MRPAGPARPIGQTLPFLSTDRGELRMLLPKYGLGFSRDEIARLKEYFGKERRDPTIVELAGLAQSWSEHCSYKSSKVFLKRYFGGLPANGRALAMGDAGVMPLNDTWAYALRMESHNHPSAIEPYGGAATGIGGILRDVLAMGAKPIALADPLFFGPLDIERKALPKGVKHPRYLFRHVVSGIADYGNRVGVPTVAGLISFDRSYLVNPLVNVSCIGMVERDRISPNRVNAIGERLVLVGGLTGKDGIGGVSFASKELTGKSEKLSRPAVQLGNPIMKEPLIHAVLEAMEEGIISGMKDLGGGGLATASGELVNAGGFGSKIHLDRVPLRESGLEPWEVWVSESQERMLLSVKEKDVSKVMGIFHLHDVPATEVGEVTEAPLEEIYWDGRLVGRLNISFRVDPPLLERTAKVRKRRKSGVAVTPTEPYSDLIRSLALANESASREPVIRLYDHEVQGRTLGKPLVGDPSCQTHADAAVIRLLPGMDLGIAISIGAQPYVGAIDPEAGGALAVIEAARNLYAVGASPDSFTNCLNFGNPEVPEVMGDFDATVRGLSSAARALNMAVPSGNVSFYNGGLGMEIPPTAVVTAVGIHPNVSHPMTPYLKHEGDPLYVLGETSASLGGSLYDRMHGGKERSAPDCDGRAVKSMGEELLRLFEKGVIKSCHDISDGGLGVTMLEMAFGSPFGFDVEVPIHPEIAPWRSLVTETNSRWVLEIARESEGEVVSILNRFPLAKLGVVTEGAGTFRIGGRVEAHIDVHDLYRLWSRVLSSG